MPEAGLDSLTADLDPVSFLLSGYAPDLAKRDKKNDLCKNNYKEQ
jgi:hypothetical protein